jgi:hypothetical protein
VNVATTDAACWGWRNGWSIAREVETAGSVLDDQADAGARLPERADPQETARDSLRGRPAMIVPSAR